MLYMGLNFSSVTTKRVNVTTKRVNVTTKRHCVFDIRVTFKSSLFLIHR